jgi:hypothetical protein
MTKAGRRVLQKTGEPLQNKPLRNFRSTTFFILFPVPSITISYSDTIIGFCYDDKELGQLQSLGIHREKW